MFGKKKVVDGQDALNATLLNRVTELQAAVAKLETDFKDLLKRQQTVEAKADKYDDSVNQAMTLLRSIPGVAK